MVEIDEIIVRLNELRKSLDALQPLNKEAANKLAQKFRLEWNYNSNHIEGNTLTYGETELLLFHGKTTGDHDVREFEEMKAHDAAIKVIEEWAKDSSRDLTEMDIRSLNKIILVTPFWKEALTYDGQPVRRQIKVGQYKEHPNSVRLQTGEMFHYAPPEDTPRLMNELMGWYHKSEKSDPVVLAAEFHYRFIRIHPFDDGNGRIARLLVNYVLIKNGYPPVIVKSADKESYLTALRKADTGDIEAFHIYIAKQLVWSLETAIKAGKGESIDEPDDVDKKISIWKKQFKGVTEPDIIPKSDEQTIKLYDSCFRTLFELFVSKHSQFDDLFTSVETLGYMNGNNVQHKGLESIDTLLTNQKRQIQIYNRSPHPQNKIQRQNINSLSIQITFRGFKKDGTNAFDESSNLTIDLRQYSYIVTHNGLHMIEHQYFKSIDVELEKRLVAQMVERTFNSMDTKIKRKK